MKRNCVMVAALLALLGSAGCCYRPGGINPYNGIAYGGHWSPMRGGPLDTRACCYNPWYCPTVGMADCCDPCALPAAGPYGGSYGGSYGGPYLMGAADDCCDAPVTGYPTPTYVPSPQVMPDGSEAVPGGVQPVPDPNMNPTSPKSGGATTYVVPQRLPVYQHSGYRQASSTPWVHAH